MAAIAFRSLPVKLFDVHVHVGTQSFPAHHAVPVLLTVQAIVFLCDFVQSIVELKSVFVGGEC